MGSLADGLRGWNADVRLSVLRLHNPRENQDEHDGGK